MKSYNFSSDHNSEILQELFGRSMAEKEKYKAMAFFFFFF